MPARSGWKPRSHFRFLPLPAPHLLPPELSPLPTLPHTLTRSHGGNADTLFPVQNFTFPHSLQGTAQTPQFKAPRGHLTSLLQGHTLLPCNVGHFLGPCSGLDSDPQMFCMRECDLGTDLCRYVTASFSRWDYPGLAEWVRNLRMCP